MAWTIGRFTLDRQTRELRLDGKLIAIEARVFDFLVMLATNRDRVIDKEELISSVWAGRIVSDTAITSCLKSARAALGDDGKQQRVIKTIHGKGYRFVADLTVADDKSASPGRELSLAEPIPMGGLPPDRFALFGRQAEIANVCRLLDDNRLVSLLGIGGTGKTRLAVACGRELRSAFADGVWFVDLVPVTDTHGIDLAIAEAIGLTLTSKAPRDELVRLIRSRRLLLIMDNCEHICELVAQALDELLDRTQATRILATSREPLDVTDEYRVNVEPLKVGASDDTSDNAAVQATNMMPPAVQLFCACTSRLGVTIDESDLATVKLICTHLDGLPLAIELAASQLRQLTLNELADRLDKRFDLLAGRARAGRERQASLLNVLADTWEMLDANERRLLGILAVFSGMFSVTDIEELAGDGDNVAVSHVFGGLVDKSLVRREGAQWRLLETVRLFAQRQMNAKEQRQLEDRHASWCLASIGESVEAHCFGRILADWCAAHYNDLRAARNHLARVGRHDDAARLMAAQGFALHRDRGTRAAVMLREIETYLARASEPSLLARLHFTGVMSAMATRVPRQLEAHANAGLKAARESGDGLLEAIALVFASWSTVFRNVDDALAQVRQAASLARKSGNQATVDFAESYLAWHLGLKRRYPEAIDVARQVIARSDFGPAAEDYPMHSTVNALASIIAIDEPEQAIQLMARAGDNHSDFSMWSSKLLIANCRASFGQYKQAAAICTDINDQLLRSGVNGLPDLLVPAACMAFRLGDKNRSMTWLRAVKEAGRPTQSFQMTIAYRRLSEAAGLSDQNLLDVRTLEDIGAQALHWMRSTAPNT